MDKPFIWERENVHQVLPSGCMIWMGAIRRTGYGAVTYKSKRTMPHRVAYMQAHGEAPKGMHVCHRCDVRACINPDHLFLGTAADNARDCVAKGRRPKGAENKCSKLTDSDVWEICRLLQQKTKHQDIGRRFGVSGVTIGNIAKGIVWRHVTTAFRDTMTVTPPAGFIAWPPEVTVPEGGAGTILILLEAVS